MATTEQVPRLTRQPGSGSQDAEPLGGPHSPTASGDGAAPCPSPIVTVERMVGGTYRAQAHRPGTLTVTGYGASEQKARRRVAILMDRYAEQDKTEREIADASRAATPCQLVERAAHIFSAFVPDVAARQCRAEGISEEAIQEGYLKATEYAARVAAMRCLYGMAVYCLCGAEAIERCPACKGAVCQGHLRSFADVTTECGERVSGARCINCFVEGWQ